MFTPSPMREVHIRRVLEYLVQRPDCSQRKLSRELGIALGLANDILRHLLALGLIERTHQGNGVSHKLSYVITDLGRAEHHRMSRAHLGELVHSYSQARGRIVDALNRLLTERQGECTDRIVFYGPREVAEIGCLCLRETKLRLVGIVEDAETNDAGPDSIMGVSVCSPERLCGRELDGAAFDCLLVLSLRDPDVTHRQLAAKGVPLDRVWWA